MLRSAIALTVSTLVAACGARTNLRTRDASVSSPSDGSPADSPNASADSPDASTPPPIDLCDDGSSPPPGEPIVLVPAMGNAFVRGDIAATPEGFLVVYSSDGGPVAGRGLWTMRLDPDGHPVDPPRLAGNYFATGLPRLVPASQDRFIATYCEVIPGAAVSIEIDASGNALGPEIPRSPLGQLCGVASPDVVWTGERELFTWTESEVHAIGESVFFDVADPSGTSVDARELMPNGNLEVAARIAVAADRVAVISGTFGVNGNVQELVLYLFDRMGRAIGSPTVTSVPTGLFLQLGAVFAGDDAEWILIATSPERGGLYRVRFDPSGQVIEPLTAIAMVPNRYFQLTDFEPRGAGFLLATTSGGTSSAGTTILALSAGGNFERSFTFTGGDRGTADARVVQRDGRLFVLYRQYYEAGAGDLRIRELGCGL